MQMLNNQFFRQNEIRRVVLISLYLFDSIPVRCLHTHLKTHGCEVYSIFFKEYYPETRKDPTTREIVLLIKKLREINPDVVGISVGSPFENVAKEVTREIRRSLNSVVVWGGPYPTLMPEDCLLYADYVFVGEGEENFLHFLDDIKNKADPAVRKGIWTKRNGTIVNNGFYLNESVDTPVFADFSDEQKYYIENNRIGASVHSVVGISDIFFVGTHHAFTKMYHLITKKDCIYHCSYCPDGALRNLYSHTHFKRRSVNNVIAELRHAKEHIEIKAVCFHDDIFTVDEDWVLAFANAYAQEIRVPFMINSHFFHLNEQMLASLRQAGLLAIRIGIQSGSKNSNKLFHRPFDRRKVIETGMLIRRYSVYPVYDIIVNNPFEEEVDKKATFDLLMDIPLPFKLYMHPFALYPRSKIVEYARERDLMQKCYSRSNRTYFYRLTSKESPEDAYWNPLLWLTGVVWFPRRAIRFLMTRSFLKRFPLFMKLFCCFIYLSCENRMASRIRYRNKMFQNVI